MDLVKAQVLNEIPGLYFNCFHRYKYTPILLQFKATYEHEQYRFLTVQSVSSEMNTWLILTQMCALGLFFKHSFTQSVMKFI